MKFSIISVDYQNDFCTPGGKYYQDRPCHSFIEKEFIPFLKENKLKLAVIICDYRHPGPKETEICCVPGEWGYLFVRHGRKITPNLGERYALTRMDTKKWRSAEYYN